MNGRRATAVPAEIAEYRNPDACVTLAQAPLA
jgi:hypothetical protein